MWLHVCIYAIRAPEPALIGLELLELGAQTADLRLFAFHLCEKWLVKQCFYGHDSLNSHFSKLLFLKGITCDPDAQRSTQLLESRVETRERVVSLKRPTAPGT